jgi:predicted RNA-binding protein with PUA-like domain
MSFKYFLAKSEPNSYSIEDLVEDQITWWDGVHNYQAINVIKSWNVGDKVFFYRSQKEPAVVGLMEVISNPIFDTQDLRKISWKAQCKIIEVFEEPVKLKDIKETRKFDSFILLRNSRLSVMACTEQFTNFILDTTKPIYSLKKGLKNRMLDN